ncbi:MAG TPA: VWA domain-containing protein [Bryobacteraceae bacterium]|nr:VWA domain-containing protein [Bryobacteraceae bacterium]
MIPRRRFVIWAMGAAVLAQEHLPRGPVFRAQTALVEIHATVLDPRGRHLRGLQKDDFEIIDGSEPRKPEIFESEESPISLGLLLDITGSMQEALPAVKHSALRLVTQLRPADQVAVFVFNNRLWVLSDFTVDRDLTAAAIRSLRAAGTTALFDALAGASQLVSQRQGKRALLVFTDGNDNASALTLERAVERARREAIPVYTVAQGEALRARNLTETLEVIARSTGGLAFKVRKPVEIDEAFSEISRDLTASYLLAFKPRPGHGEWRTLVVRVRGRKNLQVRSREGYFAP